MASEPTRRRRLAAGARLTALAVALALVAAPAAAQPTVTAADKETARQLMDEGDRAFASGDHATALKKYQGADDIMGVPTTAFEVGKTLEAMGNLVEARDAYLRVVRFPLEEPNAAFEEAKRKADERAAALGEAIATLQLTVEGVDDGTDLEILIDGVAVSAAGVGRRSVNPGAHRIVVRAPGYLEGTADVSLGRGETKSATITLEKDPDAATAPAPTKPAPTPAPGTAPGDAPGMDFPVWATVGFSVGLVGFGVGAAFGILSLAKAGDLEEACDGDVCQAGVGLEKTQDDALLFANLSNVGFIVGGVGTAFGVVALFTLDASDDASETGAVTIRPVVGPTYLGVTGRF